MGETRGTARGKAVSLGSRRPAPTQYRIDEGKSFTPPAEGKPFIPFKKFQALRIPWGLAEYRGLSPGAKLVWGCYERHAFEDGECFPGIRCVARETGMSVTQARAYERELERAGFVRINQRQGLRSKVDLLWRKAFDGLDLGAIRIRPPLQYTGGPTPLQDAGGLPLQDAGDETVSKTVVSKTGGQNGASSSVPPLQHDEEEDLKPITTAIEKYQVWNADQAIVSKIFRIIKTAAPTLDPAEMAFFIHAAVPNGYAVNSAGFWLKALPKLLLSDNLEKGLRRAIAMHGPQKKAEAPFSAENLRAYLTSSAATVRKAGFPEIAQAVDALAADANAHLQNLEQLEQLLTALEEKLIGLLKTAQTDNQLFEARRELDSQLRPYRGKMTPDQLAMLERQYLERRLFESAHIDRLSTFYMH